MPRPALHPLKLTTALLAAGFLVLTAGAGAAAADPTTTKFKGTVEWSDANGEEAPYKATITLKCSGDSCDASGFIDGETVPVTITGGQGHGVIDDTGDPCNGDYELGVSVDFTVSADGMNAQFGSYGGDHNFKFKDDGLDFWTCSNPDGSVTHHTYSGWSASLVAKTSSGDPCTIATVVCPEEVVPDSDEPEDPFENFDLVTPFHAVGGYDLGTSSELVERPSDPAAPSVLAGLPTIQATDLNPIRLTAATILAFAAAGILALSLLANSAVTSSGGNIVGKLPWVKALGKRITAVRDRANSAFDSVLSAAPIVPWIAIALTYVVAVLLSSLLDPGAGSASGTVRMLLSLLTVFAIQSVVGWFAVRLAMKRGGEPVEFRPSINPGMLLVIVLGVVLSRLLGFEPGVVYGALLGLTFGATLRGTRQAKVVLIGSLVVVSVSFVSWVLYSIGVAAGLDSSGVVGVFVLETLSGLVVAGASGLAIALLPHKAFDGKIVWDWNRIYWVLLYAGGAFYALVVLGLLPLDVTTISAPFVGWLLLYLLYGGICLVMWLLARRAARGPVVEAPAQAHVPTA